MPLVTLIGYRGTGKSTVAVELARALDCERYDADDELEAAVGMPIGRLVKERGEAAFRDEEERVLGRLLRRHGGVLATGGGVVLREGNREALRSRGGLVAWLTAPADVIRRRLAADPATATRRPGLTGADPLAEVDAALAMREPLYRECAACTFDTASLTPAGIAAAIRARLDAEGAFPAGSGGRRP